MLAATKRLDVLRWPPVAAFVRWRYSRLVLQLPLLFLALLAVYDGFTGSQISPKNVATVSVWVHYRGLVALTVAVFGNLFCAACPLMLTRGLSKQLSRVLPRFSWPMALRNKHAVLVLTLLFFFSYEHFDLWASPFLTAWLIVAYFLAALLTDTFFPAGTFCKYVCPLGNFNFALANLSPTQITAKNQDTCTTCVGKYCLNGRLETSDAQGQQRGTQRGTLLHRQDLIVLPMAAPNQPARLELPGCETQLFVPAMQSTTDCTLCFNCVRACPHDNVALVLRSPTLEASQSTPRSDWALFTTMLLWAGLLNAFAMIPPYFALAEWLAKNAGWHNETLLLLVFVLTLVGGGVLLSGVAARFSGGTLRDFSPVMLPLALAMWGGHYLFHFLIGYQTLWPNVQQLFGRLGLDLGSATYSVDARIRDTAFVWQLVLTGLGFLGSVWVLYNRLERREPNSDAVRLLRLAAPQLLLILVYTVLTLLVFSQPMQARASLLQGL